MTALEDGTFGRPTAPNDRVAANIRAAMAIQKVSSSSIAERIGADPRWVQRRVAGTAELTVNDVEWIALALDVPAASLLTLTN